MKKRLIFDTASQENLIECDNPKCDYKIDNPSGDVHTDCSEYINRACPKCGSNLLTQKDYDNYANMIRTMNWINKWFSWIMFFIPNPKYKTAEVHAKGGKINTKVIDPPVNISDSDRAELLYGDEHYECGDR